MIWYGPKSGSSDAENAQKLLKYTDSAELKKITIRIY